jgi:hypothetical protein
MAEPVVDEATFPGGLPKTLKKSGTGTIKGMNLKEDHLVKVVGHSGKKSYVWVGKVGKQNADGSWPVTVTLIHEKKRAAKEGDRPTEDVSTTVTNPTTQEESQPVNTPTVTLVP